MFSLLESRNVPRRHEESASGADGILCEHDILQQGSLARERGTRRRLALLAALSMEGSGLAAISAHYHLSAILLLLGLAAVAWGYRAESPDSTKPLAKLLAVTAIAGTAVAVVVLVQPHYAVAAPAGDSKTGEVSRGQKTGADTSYTSVILWPKPPRVVRVASLPPVAQSSTVVRPSRPLVIPFNGVYWYLRLPAKAPGRNAHIAHGSPTKIEIHSADWHPLIMEAHQHLAASIDATCCRDLELSILNADNGPGEIRIAVVLIDSSSQHVESEDLGTQPVRSSMPPEFSLSRPPAQEVLEYPMPTGSEMRQFNEIEVIFLPSRERSLGGVQIAIQSFRLLPE